MVIITRSKAQSWQSNENILLQVNGLGKEIVVVHEFFIELWFVKIKDFENFLIFCLCFGADGFRCERLEFTFAKTLDRLQHLDASVFVYLGRRVSSDGTVRCLFILLFFIFFRFTFDLFRLNSPKWLIPFRFNDILVTTFCADVPVDTEFLKETFLFGLSLYHRSV